MAKGEGSAFSPMDHCRWKIAQAAGPALRLFPPWIALRAYQRLAGKPFQWGGLCGIRRVRLAPHGYFVELDLRAWTERCAAILGQYYEHDATAVLEAFLRPGDVFLDVGGNVGFLSLTASRLVGARGQVIYVEPNGELVKRFRDTCEYNAIVNVKIVEAALGEISGEASLGPAEGHEIAQLQPGQGVRVIEGDPLIDEVPPTTNLLVKIDVEGYEEKALAGLSRTIARSNSAFLIEVTDSWLRCHGGGAQQLFDRFDSAGYRGRRSAMSRARLQLETLDAPSNDYQYNVVFTRPGQFADDTPK